MYHCASIPVSIPNPPLRMEGVLPNYLKSTLYPTPKNLSQQNLMGSPNRGMTSLAIHIKKCPDQGLKRIRLSAGFQLATLRHFTAPQQHMWLNQLIEMFDVTDYPIHGYKPSSTLTELNLHLWDCSIDYRPLYLPYRALATISTFMISSNITSIASAGCTLRFIAEDCTLSMAPQVPLSAPDQASEDTKITVLPSEQLVCVVELGLFEISLRLGEKPTASFPKYDLRAAINDVHIRTCSDSGQALAKLIAYIASESDLRSDTSDESSTQEQADYDEDCKKNVDLLSNLHRNSTLAEEQLNVVNDLLSDAMEECLNDTLGKFPSILLLNFFLFYVTLGPVICDRIMRLDTYLS